MDSNDFWNAIRFITFVAIVVGMLHGVTVNGRHYEVSCDDKSGVVVDGGAP